MKNRLLTFLALALLTISVPGLTAAAPGEHHHSGPKPALDWSAYPADIQALKGELDQIRAEQKGLFEQLKSQNDQIKEARKALTSDQRRMLMKPAKELIAQMKSSRDEIHSLRSRKHEAWDSFHEHAASKQWINAKNDLQTIIKHKRQILENQQRIVRVQKQLIALINPSHESHFHSIE